MKSYFEQMHKNPTSAASDSISQIPQNIILNQDEDDEEQEDEDEEKKEDSNIIVRNQKRKRSHTIFQSQ